MSSLREFVSELSEAQMTTIIRQHIEFEKEGVIGDCLLREKANEYLELVNGPKHRIVMWMELMANEVYRRLALEFLKEKNNDVE